MSGRSWGIARRLVRRHPGLTLIALPCATLAIVAGLVWFPGESPPGAATGSSPAGAAPVAQNRPAPSFDLPRLYGSGRLSLDSLRDHIVVVNFWASWCTVCQHEVPALQQLSRRYRGTDVDFVGIDHGDQRSSARAFAQRNGMSYPSVVDDSDDLLGKYGPVGLPTTYVIDRGGRIRFQVIGAVEPGALRRAIDRVRAGRLACACGETGNSTPPAPDPALGQRLHAELPASVGMASLRDSSGRPVSLDSLHGKVVVLSDILTLCQETCPLDTANVVSAARKVEAAGLGKRVVFLSVTVDPQRDTQHRLAVYRRLYNPALHDWLTLTGPPATLRAFWKRLGVFVKRVPGKPPAPLDWLTGEPLRYDVTHSDAVFFLDPNGRERFVLEGSPHVAAGAPIPPTLRRFLSDKGHRNLTHPDAHAWTLQQELSVISWIVGQRV